MLLPKKLRTARSVLAKTTVSPPAATTLRLVTLACKASKTSALPAVKSKAPARQ